MVSEHLEAALMVGLAVGCLLTVKTICYVGPLSLWEGTSVKVTCARCLEANRSQHFGGGRGFGWFRWVQICVFTCGTL